MIYIVVFFISILILYINKRELIGEIGWYRINISNIIAAFGLCIPAVLAGIRADSVGVDVQTYVIYSFNRILSYTNIKQFMQNVHLEFGYEGFLYIISRGTNDIHWVHFFTAIIILIGIYKGCKAFSNKISIPVAMLSFYCIYYNQSLNTVRQWMAIGICFYGMKFLVNKKFIPYLLVCLMAMLFHKTALIGIIIYFLYWSIMKKNKTIEIIKCTLYWVLITIICTVLFEQIIDMLININIIPIKYSRYLVSTEGNASKVMTFLVRLPLVVVGGIYYKSLLKYDKRVGAVYTFILMDIPFALLSGSFGYAGRISLYFGIWQIVLISEIYRLIKRENNRRISVLVLAIIIIVLLAYWYAFYIYRGFSGTYPYITDVI